MGILTNVALTITSYHHYHPASRATGWSAKINTNTVFSIGVNAVSLPTGAPLLGIGVDPFDGDIVELMIYNSKINAEERSTINEYLRRKYGLW